MRTLLHWLILFVGTLGFLAPAAANVPVRFARTPALSPDGEELVFGWRGDLWIVDSKEALSDEGGVARRVTAHKAYDGHPIWSPKGDKLAFVSYRKGNADLFVMKAFGGVPKQLTHLSSEEKGLYWLANNKTVVFHSSRNPGITRSYRLYTQSENGGMPRTYLNIHASDAALSPNGQHMIVVRGSRRWWRKRWKMPFHRSLWLYNTQTKKYKRLTPAGYTADYPSWISNEEIIFRSERTKTFNVWKLNIKTGQMTPFTHYKGKGVRFVRASRNRTAAVFTRWDRTYNLNLETGLIKEFNIRASGDTTRNRVVRKIKKRGISEFAVSPVNKEVALIVHGDLFIKRLKDPNAWARRIASSHWREKQINWSPNGKHLAFVSDRGDQRDSIYLVHAGKKHGITLPLSRTWEPKVTRITKPNQSQPEHSPSWSPRGKELAFLRGRGQLIVRNIKSGKERIVVDSWNISTFRWSPDGKWFVYTRTDRESNSDVFLVRASGKGRSFNVSRFPDSDFSPVWSANGRVLAFLSRGINNSNGIRYAFLRKSDNEKSAVQLKRSCKRWAKKWKRTQIRKRKALMKRRIKARKAYKRRKLAKRRLAKKKAPSTRPASRPTKKKLAKKKARKKARKRRKQRPMRVDLAQLPFRLRFIPNLPGTRGPSRLSISPTGCNFYIEARGRGESGLYQVGLFGRKLRKIAKGRISRSTMTAKGAIFYLARGGSLFALVGKRKKRAMPIRFMAEVEIDHLIAGYQKFAEGWSWLEQWFYDPKFHGVDWFQMRKDYKQLLKHAHTQRDYNDVVNMMLGELNASHLGIYGPWKRRRMSTGDLGVTFDLSYKGKGLKIATVRSESPASRKRSRLAPGDVILSIDGRALSSSVNIHQYLNHTLYRHVLLKVKRRSGKIACLRIKPMNQRSARYQRYKEWVKLTRKRVHKWGGKLMGYAHIRSMGITSLDRFERDLFAHAHGKEGLILDLRNNGGGWTADLLLAMFFPKPHAYTQFRGSRKGYPVFRRPFYSWHKPIVLLINERSVSNAEIFAHAFRNLKRGIVVGMPTYGGVISTRNVRLLDGSLFRIPLRGWWTLPGKTNMENGPAQPHIVIPLLPAEESKGKDPQLMRAVRELLKEMAKAKAKPKKAKPKKAQAPKKAPSEEKEQPEDEEENEDIEDEESE